MLKKAGYKPFDRKASYVPGDKVYVVNREKAVIATTFGKKPLKDGLRINGAHIDAPRLDLKPNPLYEKEDIAYLRPITTAASANISGEPCLWQSTAL